MDERAAERPEALPGELAWRLREVESTISPEEIAHLWVFPPLSDVEHSAEFLLFTRYLENERRRLYTARLPAEVLGTGRASSDAASVNNGRNGDGGAEVGGSNGHVGQEIRDHGTVPAERMPRFVEKFLRRLDGETGTPIHVEVNGCRERWSALQRPSENGSDGSESGRRNGHRGSIDR
jgi:hypothetical protein